MKYYAVYIPDLHPDCPVKSCYTDPTEALAVLKQHKNARFKGFASYEEAMNFYLSGPSDEAIKSTTPTVPLKQKFVKPQFIAPVSQKLVAFRKLIEANNVSEVQATIQANPRYLISSGDTPTILKEGPRYNALHIAAIEGREEICRLVLQTVSSTAYIELLHGQRSPATNEVCAILLDMYLNMPDKSRNETPLHFAAKHGSVGVVKELMAYLQCKVSHNADGMLPRDIICSRAKAANDTPEIRQAIHELLEERFFVPVLRTLDESVPAIVGEPFTTANPPKLETDDVISSRREIKAYAGPMDRDRALSFFKRWRTPPRLIPQSPCVRSMESPKPTGFHRKINSSTPRKIQQRRLFGNSSLDPGGQEGDVDLLTTKLEKLTIEDLDNNGNHWIQCDRELSDVSEASDESSYFNVSFMCDENQELYALANVAESPSCRERSIRLHDIAKGLETIGRTLALQRNVGWREHWGFLGEFCNLASADGLQKLDAYLAERSSAEQGKQSEKLSKEVNVTTNTKGTANLEEDKTTITKDERSKVSNSYLCLLKSLQVFAIRFSKYFTEPWGNGSKPDWQYEEAIVKVITKLDTMVDNYRQDSVFHGINFSKVHSLFAYMTTTYILQASDSALGKVKEMVSHFVTCAQTGHDYGSDSLVCIFNGLTFYTENAKLVQPIDLHNQTEQDCRTMWERSNVIRQCNCRTSNNNHAGKRTQERLSKRREQRTNLAESARMHQMTANFDTYRNAVHSTPKCGMKVGEEYFSCSDTDGNSDDSDNDIYATPPSSPSLPLPKEFTSDRKQISDSRMYQNDSETTVAQTCFFTGTTPGKDDYNVWNVLQHEDIDEQRYPHVFKWKKAMVGYMGRKGKYVQRLF
ncbi:ankyrin repeat and LEM domain-containing protein 2 homolog isoform X2 [Anopheles bellator]|uniref:ankyrin repeat and LEM domain-containing protein 2 homolog isoform X2 n=1 Tax=Anopheles bellator TaxID=139047 RepID=UPI00264919EE|nr:ankyrin repeat and LEM domain-containing protein 2 homolog isoform X2 [Anopheles bellator]